MPINPTPAAVSKTALTTLGFVQTTDLSGYARTSDLNNVATQDDLSNVVRSTDLEAVDTTSFAANPAVGRNALTGWFHAAGFGAKGDGSTNDSAAINSAIAAAYAAGGGVVYLQATGAASGGATVYCVGTPSIILRSGVELRISAGVIVRRFTGWTSNLIKNTAATPTALTGGSISSGSTTLTVTSGAFTSADVGKSVVVVGAGATYTGGAPLSTTIASVTDATHVVLALAAGTTVSGAAVRVYTRDSDIAITGEVGARIEALASGQQNTTDAVPVLLRNVDRARVGGRDTMLFVSTTDTSGGGKYAIWLYACTNWLAENINFNVQSDGVHVTGLSKNFIVRNITGFTHDDSVALVGNERLTSTNVDGDLGDMTDFVIENVSTTTERNGVKLLPCRRAGESTGFTIARGVVRNISGSHLATELQSNAVVMGAANAQDSTSVYSGGLVRRIEVDGATTATTRDGVALYNCTFRNITLARIKNVVASNGATIEDLTVRDSYMEPASGVSGINLGIQLGTVGPTVTTLRVENVRYKNAAVSAGPIAVSGNGSSLANLVISGLTCEQGVWGIGQFNSDMAMNATGLNINATNLMAVGSGATVTVTNLAKFAGADTVVFFDSGKLRSQTFGLKADLSTVQANVGDMLTNTNSTLNTGVGPVVCSAAGWRNIATNASLTFTAPAVAGLSALGNSGSVSLGWSAPNNGGSTFTGLALYRGTAAGVSTSGTPIATLATTATSYVDNTATNGTKYYYVLVYTNSVGSTASNEANATPTAAAAGTTTTIYSNTMTGAATAAGAIDTANLADPSTGWLLNGSGATVTARPSSGNATYYLFGKAPLAANAKATVAVSTTLGTVGSSTSSQLVTSAVLCASNVPTAAATDPTSQYVSAWNGASTVWEIRKVVSGTTTVLASSAAMTAPSASAATAMSFYIKAIDSSTGAVTLGLSVGGTEVASYQDTSSPLTGTYWGLFVRRNTSTGSAPVATNLTVTTTA